MRTHRKLLTSAGVALGATSLVLATTATSFGSSTAGFRASDGLPGVVPSATAPHAGHVQGAQYGRSISINNPSSVHAFRVLHRDLIAGSRAAQGGDITTIHPSKGTSFNASD